MVGSFSLWANQGLIAALLALVTFMFLVRPLRRGQGLAVDGMLIFVWISLFLVGATANLLAPVATDSKSRRVP